MRRERKIRSNWFWNSGMLPIAALALVASCGGGGGGGSSPPGTDVIFLPGGSKYTVASNRLSVEFGGSDLKSVKLTGGPNAIDMDAFAYGDSFFLRSVPLDIGANDFTVEAILKDDSPSTRSLRVSSAPTGPPRVELDVTPAKGIALPHPVALNVRLAATAPVPVHMFIDVDGDEVFDQDMPFSASVDLDILIGGPFKPSATVRFSDGSLTTSSDATTPIVSIVGPSPADPALEIESVGSDIVEIESARTDDNFFVLDASVPEVKHFDFDGELLLSIPLGALSNPQGMGVDSADNLYICDTGNGRVLKLLASSGYMPDPMMPSNGFFGTPGTGPGELDAPMDVIVTGGLNDPKIFVADAGNSVIARYSTTGQHEVDLAGFTSPSRLVMAGAGLRVLDMAGTRISFVGRDGALLSAFSSGTANGQFTSGADLAIDPGTGWILSLDRTNAAVQILDSMGSLLQVVAVPEGTPRTVASQRHATGTRVIVAVDGDTKLHIHPLTIDPIGQDPVMRVQGLIDSLVAEDWALAKTLVTASTESIIDQFDASVPAQQTLAPLVGNLTDLILERQSSADALVSAANGTANRSTFILRREGSLNEWLVSSF
jgi:hypothetical protein